MSAVPVDDLALAREAFQTWRSKRPGPGRLPEHLWALAESLVDRYSPQTVARELGLNTGRLRARLEHRAAPQPKGRSSKPAFVELRGADLAATPASATSRPDPAPMDEARLVRLTLERTDGTALTLALPADDPAAAERLIAVFISATA